MKRIQMYVSSSEVAKLAEELNIMPSLVQKVLEILGFKTILEEAIVYDKAEWGLNRRA